MAPIPATAAGTALPTARNLDATATPHDSPSAERATIEKVMRPSLVPCARSRCAVGAPRARTSPRCQRLDGLAAAFAPPPCDARTRSTPTITELRTHGTNHAGF